LSRRWIIVIPVVAAIAVVFGFYSFIANPSQRIMGIVWHRSGGFAGLNEKMTIGFDGSGVLSSSFLGEAEFILSETEWKTLKDLILASGFMKLDSYYKPKSNVADYFSYELTVETDSTSKTVKWVDDLASEDDLPEGLLEIGNEILEIIQGTGTGSVEGFVLDDGGSPLSKLTVSIIKGTTGFPEIAVITGEDGYYKIDSIPPGVFTLGVHDDSGKKLTEDTVFIRGGKTSRLDFIVSGEVKYDLYGAVGLFERGIHVIATETDPTSFEVEENFDVSNDYWKMLMDSTTLEASSEEFISILISRGDQSTGGYLIQVESFTWLESYPVVFGLDVDFIDPGEGVPVTEAFTNPVALIPVGQLDPGLYIVRAHIDLFIMRLDESGKPVYDPVETLVEEVWETEFEIS
jgi:hypothetical protein